jgi:hypothetical protein
VLSLLVSLGPANQHPQAALVFLDVGDVERDELRTAKRASEAEQQQGAIASSAL